MLLLLSSDVLLSIVQYVTDTTNLSLVCHHLHAMLKHRYVKLSATQKITEGILHCVSFCVHLDLRVATNATMTQGCIANQPSRTDLAEFPTTTIQALSTRVFDDDVLPLLLCNSKKLRNLFVECGQVEAEFFSTSVMLCVSLQSLHLRFFGREVYPFIPRILENLARHYTQLVSIILDLTHHYLYGPLLLYKDLDSFSLPATLEAVAVYLAEEAVCVFFGAIWRAIVSLTYIHTITIDLRVLGADLAGEVDDVLRSLGCISRVHSLKCVSIHLDLLDDHTTHVACNCFLAGLLTLSGLQSVNVTISCDLTDELVECIVALRHIRSLRYLTLIFAYNSLSTHGVQRLALIKKAPALVRLSIEFGALWNQRQGWMSEISLS